MMDQKDCTSSELSSNCQDDGRETQPDPTLSRYMVDDFKRKASASKEVPFEEIDLTLYSPTVKLIGFRTSEKRMTYWLRAFIARYMDYLSNQSYKVIWEEIESSSHPGKSDRVKISVSYKEEKLFVITVFVTTGRIQVQGTSYKLWASTEFPLFLRLIDYLEQASLTSIDQHDLEALSCRVLFYKSNHDDEDGDESEIVSDSSDSEDDNNDNLPSDRESMHDNGESLVHESSHNLVTALADLELNFTQTKINLEKELKSIHDSLEEVLFMKDRVVRVENNNKAYITNIDDKLHLNQQTMDEMKKMINDLFKQVKNLQDQRTKLLSKQTEMTKEIVSLQGENSSLKQELFVMKEIIQKHENAIESSTISPPESPSYIPDDPNPSDNQPSSQNQNDSTYNPSTSGHNQADSPTTTKSTTSNKSKKASILFIDSNGKFLKPEILYPEEPVIIRPVYTLHQLQDALNEIPSNGANPASVVIHCGTNDIEKAHPELVIRKSKEVLSMTKKRFPSSRIIYSSLLPRHDSLQQQVVTVNQNLSDYCQTNNITFVPHDHIDKRFQYHDFKHLNRQGVKFFAKNIKSAIFGTPTKQSKQRGLSSQSCQAAPTYPAHMQRQSVFNPSTQPRNNSVTLRLPAEQPTLSPPSLHNSGRPSYAAVASPTSARNAMDSGLHATLQTLLQQLQMFIS